MEGGRKRLSWTARNGAQRQGKKVVNGRCGRTIEAKPVSGQTCPIEPQKGAATRSRKGRTVMVSARLPWARR